MDATRRGGLLRPEAWLFSAAYLAGRAQGLAPVSAARQATGVVAALLPGAMT